MLITKIILFDVNENNKTFKGAKITIGFKSKLTKYKKIRKLLN